MNDGVRGLLIVGFGFLVIFFLFGLLVYQNEKSWENPIVYYWKIQDPATEKIYICHPEKVSVSSKIGNRISFTDTNGIQGNLLNYIILKKGSLIKRGVK